MNFTPIPTPQQAAFQDWAFGLFFHFGIRTFYEGHRDWDGKPMPAGAFNPTALDCRQWTAAARAAGAKYAVLVAKHHDSFANWPTRYSDYSVAQTPWKGGKGDVVREFVEACRADNLKVGLYYSPAQAGFLNWQPREYDDYFVNQITELLTNYGKIDYLWFDACGSGDHRYDTPRIVQVIRRLQPDILLFNLWDPDTRWIGNESGVAGLETRSYVDTLDTAVDVPNPQKMARRAFLPAECDCCIRGHTWFYSDANEDQLKSVEELFGLYCTSVGNNANFLLNVGPDRRGLLPEKDVERLTGLGREIRRRFQDNVLPCTVAVTEGVYRCTLPETRLVGGLVLEEDPGERITAFQVALQPADGSRPVTVYRGQGVGRRRFCLFPPLATREITVTPDAPTLSRITLIR